MQYYDLKRNWRKVRPHLDAKPVQATLVKDFNKFTWGRWRQKFTAGHTPHEFESCDWFMGHRGRMPAFWQYVKHSACHWLVNFNLELAMQVEPKRAWRIVTSDKHSTVWDGEDMLFDFNFLALGVPPDEAFSLASDECDSEVLPPGEHLHVHLADHYTVDLEQNKQRQRLREIMGGLMAFGKPIQ